MEGVNNISTISLVWLDRDFENINGGRKKDAHYSTERLIIPYHLLHCSCPMFYSFQEMLKTRLSKSRKEIILNVW